MRKIYLLFTIFIFTAVLFAEQPFFLKNWIIPDDFVWGDDKNIPAISGTWFYQNNSKDQKNPYVTFNDINKSNIDFPPYFTERNLLSWDMTYEEILDAFKDNEEFFIDDYVYPLYKNEAVKGISFLDIIQIICRNENHINIEVYFPHTPTVEERYSSKPSYCYIYYNRKGLKENEMEIPDTERFELLYREIWDENTPDEKKIIALTYFSARMYDFIPAKYDCSLLLGNNKKDAADCLKNKFSVKNTSELLDYVQKPDYKNVNKYYDALMEYDRLLQVMDENPDKYIIELGAEKYYSLTQISRMFFIDKMRDYLGEYGVAPYVDVDRLFALRLGVGAGYITREQSMEYGLPIAEQLLKQYNSFYDFAAHIAAYESYLGVESGKTIEWAQSTMFRFNGADKYMPLDEINFDASQAGEALVFDDAYYKPEGEAFTWYSIRQEKLGWREDVPVSIKKILADYKKVPCLDDLINQIRCINYFPPENRSQFFGRRYQETWDKLPENEQYAIAFSSNLFQLNEQYHLDFENRIRFSSHSGDPEELLRDSWGIVDYDGLIEMFNSLEEYGHSGAYKSLSELLDKNPDKEALQIAVDEQLSMLDATRLQFVKETRDMLGSHGIEAWDQGREITILRWGISCGYISSKEAMALIEPVVERIRENYVSFYDYIAHYIIGRQFYALYEGNNEQLGNDAKQAALTAEAYIPFGLLEFSAVNADKEHMVSFADCIIHPSYSFTRWQKVMELYTQDSVSEASLKQLEQFENEMPECKNYFSYWHTTMLYYLHKYDEVIQFVENNMTYLRALQKDNFDYANSIYLYICALNDSFKPQKALAVYNSQPEKLKDNVYYYYQYALSNYLMLSLCDSQSEFDYYKSAAKNAFLLLKNNNYNLNESIENWLKTVQ